MEVNNENNVNTDPSPDVNINSWIFIEKHTINEHEPVNIVNTEGRIQHLTEEDLRSSGSESYSDSDGISVISENECCTCISESEVKEQDDIEIQNNTNIIDTHSHYEESSYTDAGSLENLQIMPKDSAAKSKMIYITTVTGMCFLATYFFWPKTMDVDVREYISDKIIYSDSEQDYTDMTNDDIFKHVYDKQILSYYEHANNTCDISVNLSQNKLNNFHSGNSFMYQTYSTIKRDISIKNNKNQLMFRNAQRQKDTKRPNISKKDIKLKNTKNKKNKALQFKEDYLYKKDKYLIKKEKYLKKIEREINQLEAKLHQAYRLIKKEGGKNKKMKVNVKKTTHPNITGDWYHNLYSGRSELRYKEKLSDWVFDRSKMRSKLREKESWYFSRVKGREQFRSNEKYKIYKSYRY